MKKILQIRVILSLVMVFMMVFAFSSSGFSNESQVKNVIVLICDGTGSSHITLSRWYKGSPLTLDEMLVGGIKTYCSNSIITDSAPAATAFATGFKSDSGFISVLPSEITVPSPENVSEKDKYRPVATILEAAKLKGMATGIIATSLIQHATPACFSAHVPDRNNYIEIAEQQVYQQMDVVLGAGKFFLLPKTAAGMRNDGANLIEELNKMGYDFVENVTQMRSSSSNKIWGAFANESLAYDFDRDPAKEPSLAEMTQKGIEVLSRSPKGFFLMVEGSKIDWASHANDPVGVISDVLAFDAAVKVALDFAKNDRNTLVVACADHGNGGMSIGNMANNYTYEKLSLASVIDPLKKATLTGEGAEKLYNADRSNVQEVLAGKYNLPNLTPAEINYIKMLPLGYGNYAVGPILSKRCGIGWTTNGHTGEDLFLYAFGPNKPCGLLDNTEIAKHLEGALRLDLAEASKALFVNVADTGLEWSIKTDYKGMGPNNPFVVITSGKNIAELQVSTNIMYLNGKIINLEGITYLINGVAYITQQALDLLKAAK